MSDPPNHRPNLLLITTDQQRGDCLAADPHAPAPLQTPNLDFLAHCTGRSLLPVLRDGAAGVRDVLHGEQLAPRRARLVDLLRQRPEGFVDGGALVAGRPHEPLLPGFDPDATYPFT